MNEITGKVLTGLAVIGILFVLRYVKERTRFDELLARGIKGFDRKRAAPLRKELADGERESNYMLPNEARREWLAEP